MPKSDSKMLYAFRQNLEAELQRRALDMQAASVQANLGKTFVRDVIKRERDPGLSYVLQLVRAHRLSLDRLLGLGHVEHPPSGPVRIKGDVGAGAWHQVDMDERDDESPLPADPRYPAEAQYDLVVRGNSINRFARDGELLRVVDLERAGIETFDDDMIIFRRTKDGGQLVQMTAKRMRKRGPMLELWPDSDDPRWQEPERIDTRKTQADEGKVIALVLYAFNPARPAQRR